jgi:hypothetical protein
LGAQASFLKKKRIYLSFFVVVFPIPFLNKRRQPPQAQRERESERAKRGGTPKNHGGLFSVAMPGAPITVPLAVEKYISWRSLLRG